MYEAEIMPYCLAIGITADEFWHLNPRKLKPYQEAYLLKRKSEDTMNYYCGIYTFEAVTVALHNALSDKKPMKYRDKPLLAEAEQNTDEEKIKKTEAFFNQLKIMQANFNLSKGAKNESTEPE